MRVRRTPSPQERPGLVWLKGYLANLGACRDGAPVTDDMATMGSAAAAEAV